MSQMHCPECGSKNVSCVSTTASHTHTCHDCGYRTEAAPVKRAATFPRGRDTPTPPHPLRSQIVTASGDPARWTVHVDEIHDVVNETHLVWKNDDMPIAEWYWLSAWENPDEAANTMPETALAALVADIRAARVHEGCTHATDTLREVLHLWMGGWRPRFDLWVNGWAPSETKPLTPAHRAVLNEANPTVEGPDHE